MMLIKRLMANFIDIFVFIALIVLFFAVILPFFIPSSETELSLIWAGVTLITILAVTFSVQYPFLRVNQTIGKAFFGLKIASTNEGRPLTLSIILQREVFAKSFTCYFMCLPVLLGLKGQHDIVCETEVISSK